MEKRKSIRVSAAVIRRGGTFFATQRGYGDFKDWWEWPGGKIEEGESPEEALRREIREELGAEIEVGKCLQVVEWEYPAFHLTLHCFLCTLAGNHLQLNEHEAARWLDYTNLHSVKWLPADEGLLPMLSAELLGVEPSLAQYIETEVIPQYATFDKAHREDHARAVISRSLSMAEQYSEIDRNVLYAAAACHDLGLSVDRKTHHLESGRIIRADARLQEWFTREQIETAAQATEDHRASAQTPPRSLYGRLVAEGDRMIVPETIIRRTIQFGLSHYPELEKEGHWERTLEHLHEKYAEGGYLKLLIPGSPNEAPLQKLRGFIKDEPYLRSLFEKMFAEETL